MSTQGVLIIQKNGKEKPMHILYDAYPEGAGVDIADLIKTTDLDVLFECLTEYDEWDMPRQEKNKYPAEPVPFSYGACRIAVKQRKWLWISPGAHDKICDSLFCEYAYVIDLDTGQLMFLVGGQTMPQEGNPYGTTPKKPFGMDQDYYPCRLSAVFPLEYVRLVRSETIAAEMCTAAKESEGIQRYSLEMVTEENTADENDYLACKDNITMTIHNQSNRLIAAMERMREINLENRNRIRELKETVSQVKDAVGKLETMIEIIR